MTAARAFGAVAMIGVVEHVGQIARKLAAVGFVASGFHNPVDNVQTEPGVAEAGCFVEKAAGGNPSDVTPLLDDSFEFVRCEADR